MDLLTKLAFGCFFSLISLALICSSFYSLFTGKPSSFIFGTVHLCHTSTQCYKFPSENCFSWNQQIFIYFLFLFICFKHFLTSFVILSLPTGNLEVCCFISKDFYSSSFQTDSDFHLVSFSSPLKN